MPLAPGRRLGPYEIVASLGVGGMGEVYEARDTRLGRTVAIKVLPEGLAENPERRARFEREARTISQLTHPHVCTLHDVGEEEGLHFLVMEHCEGETLAERLGRGGLSLEDTLRHGAQIAEALDAAHRRGVVHRDLKPSNVMFTSSGVKLLDFGLARIAAGGTGAGDDIPTLSADADHALTAEGTVLGTYPYMAPEQVEGAEADARSDLFSLGAVLYEMVTGKRAFEGGSAASIMAAVLKEEPEPLSRLQPVAPPALDHVVSRCLAKDPERRWQTARDVAEELRWIAEAGSEAGAAPVARRRQSRERLAWGVAGLLALGLVGAGWHLATETQGEEVPRRLSISLDESAPVSPGPNSSNLVLSPDGRRLVYLSSSGRGQERRLYLRDLDDFDARALAGTEGASVPFFSPDGEWLAFFADDRLKKMPVGGGTPRTICEAVAPRGADWGDDGSIVFSTLRGGGLLRVSAGGGSPEQITSLDPERGEKWHRHPDVLPGGDFVLFTILREGALGPQDRAVGILHLPSGERQILVEGGMHARALGLDYLIWARPESEAFPAAGTLLGAPFDPEAAELTGRTALLMEGIATVPLFGTAHFTVSSRGSLAFLPAKPGRSSLAWMSPGEEPEPLSLEPQVFESLPGAPRLSPDGRRIAVTIIQDEGSDLWIHDRERDTLQRLTYDGSAGNPIWAPDGRLVTYRDGSGGFSWKPVTGAAAAEQIVSPEWLPAFSFLGSWSGDGKLLAFTSKPTETSFDLWIADFSAVSPGSGKPELRPLAKTTAEEWTPAFFPGGRWLAYTSDESGRPEVYVVDVERPEARRQISSEGGIFPAWDPDGRELVYLANGQVFSVEVELEDTLTVGRPRSLGSLAEAAHVFGLYDVDPADRRFLVFLPEEGDTVDEIRVVLGWAEEVRRALRPGGR